MTSRFTTSWAHQAAARFIVQLTCSVAGQSCGDSMGSGASVLRAGVPSIFSATAFGGLRPLYIALLLALGLNIPAQAVSPPSISSTANGSSPTSYSSTYSDPATVTLTGPGGGATVYYTTDGTTPTTASSAYSSPFVINNPTQINAVAYLSGNYSSVVTVYLDVAPSLQPVDVRVGFATPLLLLRFRSDFGVVPGLGNPSPVNTWIDLSGSGNNATGTTGSRPTISPVTRNHPAVRFDGSSQFLTLPSGFPTFQDSNFFIVTQPTALTANARILDLGKGNTSDEVSIRISGTGSTGEIAVYNAGGSSSTKTSASALTSGQLQLLEARYNPGFVPQGTVFVNGTDGTTGSLNTIWNTTRTHNYIGQNTAGGNYYPGRILELLVYNLSSVSEVQRTEIDAYLMHKYQLFTQVPPAPTFSIPNSTLGQPAEIIIAARNGAATYYTTDGSTPTTSSARYDQRPIPINYTQTLKAISVMNGIQSSVSTASYTLDSTLWPEPNPADTAPPTINLQLPVETQ